MVIIVTTHMPCPQMHIMKNIQVLSGTKEVIPLFLVATVEDRMVDTQVVIEEQEPLEYWTEAECTDQRVPVRGILIQYLRSHNKDVLLHGTKVDH